MNKDYANQLKTYSVHLLERDSAERFIPFTYAHLSSTLRNPEDNPGFLALGAMKDGKPVGLLVGCFDSKNETGGVKSLFVSPLHRRQGVGKLLQAEFASWSERKGARWIMAEYYLRRDKSDNSATPFFAAAGWQEPILERAFYRIQRVNLDAVLDLPWAKRTLPDYMQIIPWVELKEPQLAKIRSLERRIKKSDPMYLSPFFRIPPEPRTSLSLWEGDQALGWGINASPVQDTVVFTRWYLRPDQRRAAHGAFMVLLAESVRRVQEPGPRVLTGLFNVSSENASMQHLVGRMFRSIPVIIKEKFKVVKELTA